MKNIFLGSVAISRSQPKAQSFNEFCAKTSISVGTDPFGYNKDDVIDNDTGEVGPPLPEHLLRKDELPEPVKEERVGVPSQRDKRYQEARDAKAKAEAAMPRPPGLPMMKAPPRAKSPPPHYDPVIERSHWQTIPKSPPPNVAPEEARGSKPDQPPKVKAPPPSHPPPEEAPEVLGHFHGTIGGFNECSCLCAVAQFILILGGGDSQV
jgi:hypothetical protein